MAPQRPAPSGFKLLTENRRALHRYTIEERLEVGVALMGSEVKSARANKIELGDAYGVVQGGQLTLLNAYIAPWPFAHMVKHEERRARRLLAHREEIDRLEGKITQRGFTLVALRAYLSAGKIKIELGLGKGKENADRREEIKRRESDREARAAIARGSKR
jgi:SsrA-binding protein